MENKVIDSRMNKEGNIIRRRRECLSCADRFTTYERIEDALPVVVKADGAREPFDRNKLLQGLKRAVAKRPDVLLCDEPTGALDIATGIVVLEAIERANRELGTTTAVITHNAAVAGVAGTRGVDAEVSLDHVMCCGVGACFACVVKMKAETPEGWEYVRTCQAGPVFRASQVYWD